MIKQAPHQQLQDELSFLLIGIEIRTEVEGLDTVLYQQPQSNKDKPVQMLGVFQLQRVSAADRGLVYGIRFGI